MEIDFGLDSKINFQGFLIVFFINKSWDGRIWSMNISFENTEKF